MKRKPPKIIPKFKNEAEKREFWQTHDTTNYVDYSKAHRATIEFDPSVEEPMRLIPIRLPQELLNRLRVMASKMDVHYQALIKMLLFERVLKKAA